MAQTKKQRFKAENRVQKSPAIKSPAPKVSGGMKTGMLVGGAALALAGVVTTVVLIANPFAAPADAGASASAHPVASALPTPAKLDASAVRAAFVKDYRISIDPETAQKIADSCTTAKPVSGSGRLRGVDTAFEATCVGTKLKVINSATKAEILPAG